MKSISLKAEAYLIGAKAAVLAVFFSSLQVLLMPNNLIYITAVFGVFIVTIIEISALNTDRLYRLRYGLLVSVLAGITIGLGSLFAHHYWISVLIIILTMGTYGVTNHNNSIWSTVVLFIGNLFVIGTGIPTITPCISIYYGLFFFIGGAGMFALEYLLFCKTLAGKTDKSFIPKQFFDISMPALLFTFAFTCAIVAAYTSSYLLKLPQGYWVPMTSLLIFKNCRNLAWQRIRHRIFGSLAGALLASIIGMWITNFWFLALLMGPLYFMIAVSLSRHYGTYVFFLTGMVTDMYKLIHYDGIEVTEHRIINTLIGALIVIITIFITKLPQTLHKIKMAKNY